MEQHSDYRMTHRFAEKLVDCQKLALLGRLSSNLTHEMNNQLSGVCGYAQLLLGQDRAQALAKELEKINSSATECKKLVFTFKRFARFNLREEKEYNCLNTVIQQTLEIFRRQFSKKNLQIDEKYSAGLPVLEIDAVALEQVFLNIIQNSFDALQESGSRMLVTTGQDNQTLFAVFEDDGPGFSPDALQQLFVPFFTTKEHLHCAGLGLAAAKMLLEKNQGTIAVEAPPAGGSRVKITLPLNEPQ